MEAWQKVLAESVVKPRDLAARLGVNADEIEAIVGDYPMRITPTVLGTIKEKGDAIWKKSSRTWPRWPTLMPKMIRLKRT